MSVVEGAITLLLVMIAPREMQTGAMGTVGGLKLYMVMGNVSCLT